MATIIFIHKGRIPKHLKMALYQVRKFMGSYRVILITDRIHTHIKGVEIHNINSYHLSANKFAEVYTHRSSNSYFFELICFQRWFILNDFVNDLDIQGPILYLDSDVLIYKDLFKSIELKDKIMTLTNGFGPQYSLFKNSSAIEDYCAFIYMSFTAKEKIEFLHHWYQTRFVKTGVAGGVCDMTVLWLFSELGGCLDLFSSQLYFNSTIKDIQKDALQLGFNERDFNLLNFNVKNNNAFISTVPIAALHFQGKSKEIMHRYYLGEYQIWYKHRYEAIKKVDPIRKSLYALYRKVYLKLKYPQGLPANYNK